MCWCDTDTCNTKVSLVCVASRLPDTSLTPPSAKPGQQVHFWERRCKETAIVPVLEVCGRSGLPMGLAVVGERGWGSKSSVSNRTPIHRNACSGSCLLLSLFYVTEHQSTFTTSSAPSAASPLWPAHPSAGPSKTKPQVGGYKVPEHGLKEMRTAEGAQP